MSKDPAVLFYTSDFLVGTLGMTDEQIGRYIKLLCMQHQKGHLPKALVIDVCRGEDEVIMSKFDTDEAGKFYNVRMEEEQQKRKKYTESRKKNLKQYRTDMGDRYRTPVSDTDMENININENKDENIIESKSKKELLIERKETFSKEIHKFAGQYPMSMLNDFLDYWTETKPRGWTMRWEMQPTFDINLRLKTWERNQKRFNNGKKDIDHATDF